MNPSEVSPAMTAAFAHKKGCPCFVFQPNPEMQCNSQCFLCKCKPLPASPVADPVKNPDTTCSHCGRDVNKQPWETCSNGGYCVTISELNERRQASPVAEGESQTEEDK